MTTVLPGDRARIEWTVSKPGSPGMMPSGSGVCRARVASHAAALSLLYGRRSG